MQSQLDRQILTLSDTSFGINYLTPSELGRYHSNLNSKVIIIESNDKLQGFSLLQMVSSVELSKLLFTEIPKELLKSQKIGYRKMTAVSPEFQGMGVAKKLFELGNNWLKEHGAEVILSAVWIKDGTSTFGDLLEKQGFERLVFVKEYWKKDSINRNFVCPICGDPPCVCDAMVYMKKLK